MHSDFETRFAAELRATDNGLLSGYAVVWNSRSLDLGGFVEVVSPGAFTRTLKENPDVLALVEHDMAKPLGRTTNGSLTIVEDERGLRVEINPAETSYAKDILALVRRGDVAGMSFRFRPYPGGASLDARSTPPLRTLKSIELREVSIVIDPAYPATEVAVRSAMQVTQAIERDSRMRRLRLAKF